MSIDLNSLSIENADGPDQPFVDYSCRVAGLSVHFRNLADRLIEYINQADIVLGCVAWLTHTGVLKALAKKQAAIVVQKEDFLKPDIGKANASTRGSMHKLYNALHFDIDRYAEWGGALHMLSFAGDPSIHPVRCVGNFNRERKPAHPRMHNKFLVFAKVGLCGERSHPTPVPYAVWTGSFNVTKNAAMSLENAIYIERAEVVNAYFLEFQQIMAISEPLDWKSDWSAPEWRIGS